MKTLDITKIGFFNPGRLTDEEIEMTYIARKELFEHLFSKIASHEKNDIPQHLLIIGQRGMGKTSLLLRLAVELKKAPYNEHFIPLTFPEEQYNIDRLSKFWLNTLDSLADALDREGKTELIKELDKEIAQLSSSDNLQEVDPYTVVEHWIEKMDRCPVLFVDNLNLIFDKISIDDQHKLRAILMQSGAPIVVGASATTISQTIEYGAPFYDAFQTHYLKKLDLKESVDILKQLGHLTTGDHSLDEMFRKNENRIAALHHLTGGTPRTLTMLFPLIRSGFSDEVQHDLEALLDIVTPLYKARFEELSSQMQVILDAIALNWDPIDIEDLRSVTQLSNAQLSPQLKRLIDIGWIDKLRSKKSKGGVYEISERFFNIWYLMRRSSKRQIRELYYLTKFLEEFRDPITSDITTKRSTLTEDFLQSIAAKNEPVDKYSLREGVISYQNQNLGIAKKHISEALQEVKSEFKKLSQDDWWRYGAAIIKLGYGQHFINVLKETGNHIVLRPFYEALRAMLEKDPEAHFNLVASEVREPARKILEFMKKYNED
jgi:DNA-binding transcriptional regulator GbsR (MarR family)